jgi:prepilin-type N-terminal cleavage/methylation domain-containing protein/prepilin-type processing-associated H-X9-DG protein
MTDVACILNAIEKGDPQATENVIRTKTMQHTTRKRNGFTLIELLVVIAILGLLMAILLPALSKAKEQGQAIQCQGNLRSFALGMFMYLNESDEKFCSPGKWLFGSTARYPGEEDINVWNALRWCNGDLYLRDHPEYGGALLPYVREAKSFICPTFALIAKSGSDDLYYKAEGHKIRNYHPWYNYTMNLYLGTWGDLVQSVRVDRRSQVKHPSRTFCFGEESSLVDRRYSRYGLNNTALHVLNDSEIWSLWPQAGGDPWRMIPGPTSMEGLGRFGNVLAGFHHAPTGDLLGGRGNCAFLDGHVAAHSRKETFPLAWPHEK